MVFSRFHVFTFHSPVCSQRRPRLCPRGGAATMPRSTGSFMTQTDPSAPPPRGYRVSPIVWITLALAIAVGIGFAVYIHNITTPKEDPSKPVPFAPQPSTEPDTEAA